MPNNDKTGPEGKGPKTGRGEGDCNENTSNNNNRRGFFGGGRGTGLRNGQGYGARNGRRRFFGRKNND